jgi:broad specificity phosphatase PhoE
VETDDRLRELDFGRFEGRTYEEIERDHPALYARWMQAPTTVRFPGGESYADLQARVTPALDEIRARHACPLVVAHGGVIRAALAAWLELPAHAIFRLGLDYCGVTIVEWLGQEPIVRQLNR